MTSPLPQSADLQLPAGLTPALLEGLNLPLVVTDPRQPDNPIVFVSSTFQAISGYSADEVVGRNCRFLQGPDTDPEATQRLRRAIKAGVSETVDLLNYRKSGEPFINRLLVAPLYDGHGEVAAFLGVQQEVFPAGDPLTGRLSRNMAFPRVGTGRLDDLLEDLAGGQADSPERATVFAWDIASGTLYSPDAPTPGADLSDGPGTYLVARDFLNSLHPDDADDLQSHLAGAFESPTASFEAQLRQLSDDGWRDVHVSGRFVYVGDSPTPTLLCVYLPS